VALDLVVKMLPAPQKKRNTK